MAERLIMIKFKLSSLIYVVITLIFAFCILHLHLAVMLDLSLDSIIGLLGR